MQNALLAEYAQVQLEMKKLEDRRNVLRERILSGMITEGKEVIESPLGRFTVAHKVKWIYSPSLTKAEEQLKIKKMREQDKGVATSTDEPYLIYHAPKLN